MGLCCHDSHALPNVLSLAALLLGLNCCSSRYKVLPCCGMAATGILLLLLLMPGSCHAPAALLAWLLPCDQLLLSDAMDAALMLLLLMPGCFPAASAHAWRLLPCLLCCFYCHVCWPTASAPLCCCSTTAALDAIGACLLLLLFLQCMQAAPVLLLLLLLMP